VSIAPLSSYANSYQASQSDNGWQQFAQLVGAVNAGDLDAAKQAYTEFTQSPAGKVVDTNPNSRFAQALNGIGQGLQAGDVGAAQQALATIRPHRHGSDHVAGGAGPAMPQNLTPTVPDDPTAPGATLNLTV